MGLGKYRGKEEKVMPTPTFWEEPAVLVPDVTCVPLVSLQGESLHQTQSLALGKGIWLPGSCCCWFLGKVPALSAHSWAEVDPYPVTLQPSQGDSISTQDFKGSVELFLFLKVEFLQSAALTLDRRRRINPFSRSPAGRELQTPHAPSPAAAHPCSCGIWDNCGAEFPLLA